MAIVEAKTILCCAYTINNNNDNQNKNKNKYILANILQEVPVSRYNNNNVEIKKNNNGSMTLKTCKQIIQNIGSMTLKPYEKFKLKSNDKVLSPINQIPIPLTKYYKLNTFDEIITINLYGKLEKSQYLYISIVEIEKLLPTIDKKIIYETIQNYKLGKELVYIYIWNNNIGNNRKQYSKVLSLTWFGIQHLLNDFINIPIMKLFLLLLEITLMNPDIPEKTKSLFDVADILSNIK